MQTRPTTHAPYQTIHAYRTKDGSIIRELLHPDSSAAKNQSLAEATVSVGQTTALHLHRQSEEIYHLTHGEGTMTMGGASFTVKAGDSVVIQPGTPHCIKNTGDVALRILCASAPAYADNDTILL